MIDPLSATFGLVSFLLGFVGAKKWASDEATAAFAWFAACGCVGLALYYAA